MKSEAEIKRAIQLLELFLTKQVNVRIPVSPDTVLNLQGAVRALQWTSGQMHPLLTARMDSFLQELEDASHGPGFNPQQMIAE